MTRKSIDCRSMPNEVGCTLAMSGEEDEVVRAAAQHAVDVHGHADGPELNESLRSMLVEVPG
jgi:predicted small metal-binding protein